MENEEYISVQEAAARKGVATTTIYAAINRGMIPVYRFMGRVAVRPADIDAFEPAKYGERNGVKRPRGPGRQKKTE